MTRSRGSRSTATYQSESGILRQAAVRRRATTTARRAASTAATTGPTAPASTARCTQTGAARCSAIPIPSARRASTSFRSRVRPISCKGAGGSYPSVLPKLNTAQLLAFLASLNGNAESGLLRCAAVLHAVQFASTLPQPNPFNSYQVDREDLFVLHGGDFRRHNWSGNVGVRVVRTTTLAATAESVPVDMWTLEWRHNSVQSFNVDYSSATQFLRRRPIR